jgi:DNA-directed RNA polymerase specialized sigma24 family protein
MDAKEFLSQYERAYWLVKQLQIEYKLETEKADAIRSALGSDGQPRAGVISKTVEERAIRMAEKAGELKEAELDAGEIMQEVARVINQVPNEHGSVLYHRYILLESWQHIADEVGYSLRHVYNIHDRALEMVDEILKK